jgi:hypothetical protein
MIEKRTIEWVVDAGLCPQCAWCIPNWPTPAISQQNDSIGFFLILMLINEPHAV